LLRPATFKPPGPELQLAVASSMTVYSGGKNRFAVKIGRLGFEGEIRLEVADPPPGLTAKEIVLPEDETDGEMEVTAGKALPAGMHTLVIQADGSSGKNALSASATVEVEVKHAPASLQMNVSAQVVLYQGGKSRFYVKVARSGFNDEVELRFRDLPAGVSVLSSVIPANRNDVELEITATKGAAIGAQTVHVEALATIDGARTLNQKKSLNLDVQAALIPKADVLFVLDLTGSMAFAINGVKDGIRNFVEQLENQNVDARIGLIAFRDIEADRQVPFPLQFDGQTFTKDYRSFSQQVGLLQAMGGGDEPESSLQAMVLAAKQPFREDASRVLLLITDAPPKTHPLAYPPASAHDGALELEKWKINQVHLVIRDRDQFAYKPFRDSFRGKTIDIGGVQRGNAFAAMLPKLGDEISKLTFASLPAGPKADAVPPPPATESVEDLPAATKTATLTAVQATQAFAKTDRMRLLLAIAAWTAVMAGGISLLILAGQHLYLRNSWISLGTAAKGLFDGLHVPIRLAITREKRQTTVKIGGKTVHVFSWDEEFTQIVFHLTNVANLKKDGFIRFPAVFRMSLKLNLHERDGKGSESRGFRGFGDPVPLADGYDADVTAGLSQASLRRRQARRCEEVWPGRSPAC
jgi:hypothetical protein